MDNNDNIQIHDEIKKRLNEVRTYLQNDGGDVELVEITDDMIVKVKLQGACNGCPGAVYTLKYGIENYLKERVPQVKEVQQV